MSADTIAAVATAPGPAGVAVVRISGPDAFEVAAKLAGRQPMPGAVSTAKIKNSKSGATIDHCVVLAFKSPRSYTGDDVVEIQCHGGIATPRRVLESALAAGARLARRGEFTERALLNGKLDYDQAESVLDLINAKTDRAADSALEGLSGKRKRECRDLYDDAIALSAKLEYALDVSEEDLGDSFLAAVESDFGALQAKIRKAAARIREGRLLREGALVVMAGPANVGKSSLLNALLDDERAIVSDIPGTTRDSIEAWLDIGGWPVRLVDTAGLRDTDDKVEAEGVRRTKDLIAKADLVLRLQETSGNQNAATTEELAVFTKCDLCQEAREKAKGVFTSAKTREGLDELKCEIAKRLEALAEKSGEGELSSDEYALDALQKADAALNLTKPCDLVIMANAARSAADTLGRFLGMTYSSDLLEKLFSRFCVGK